ncbi:MAG: DUF4097 domain-containing protein [Calditrichaeota bacterium]|nr:DUF4097 domain-containing protein [Calditrichota bacterium]
MNLRQLKVWSFIFTIFFLANISLAEVTDTIKESFDVGVGGTLQVEADLGSITVSTQRDNKVDVQIIRKVKAFSKKEAEKILDDLTIDFSQDGDNVNVTAKFDQRGRSFWKRITRRISLKFIISVPEKYNVDLSTAGGSISVDDLEGSVKSKTSGGSLKFGNITGPVDGKTSGGSITLDGCVGDADIRTSGGSISIGQVDGNVIAKTSGGSVNIKKAKGTVDAATSGGSINVNEVMGTINARTSGGSVNATISQQPEGECRLSTSGGSVRVTLAEDIKATIDARTSGGRVRTEFPVTVQGELKKNQLNAEINGGGPLLYLRTSGGNIYLKKL